MNATYAQPGSRSPRSLALNSYAFSSLSTGAESPIWKQVLTWVLFWPILCLIARQAPYFAGPARAFDVGLAAQAGESTGFRLSLYFVLIIQASLALAARQKIWALLKENPLIIASLALILLSALWSGSVVSTLHMWIEITLCTLFTCYLMVRMSIERLMRQLMFMGVTSALLSALFAIALPGYGVFAGYEGGAWQGITDHKNTLGISMAYLLTPVFFVTRCRRWQRLAYTTLLIFLIAMSQSRGAWLYTLGMIGFVALLYMIRGFRRYESSLLVISGLLLMAIVAIVAATSFDTIAPLLGKDGTMSGRTFIYREVWRSIMKAPLLGYGYGGFWGSNFEAVRIGTILKWPNINYSESGVLELALQLGLAGVGLVFFAVGRAIIQGVRLLRSRFYSPHVGWFLTILFLAALTNIDAGWLLASDTLDWVMILIACIGLEITTKNIQASRISEISTLSTEGSHV